MTQPEPPKKRTRTAVRPAAPSSAFQTATITPKDPELFDIAGLPVRITPPVERCEDRPVHFTFPEDFALPFYAGQTYDGVVFAERGAALWVRFPAEHETPLIAWVDESWVMKS